jgi:hypothetical protein
MFVRPAQGRAVLFFTRFGGGYAKLIESAQYWINCVDR